MTRRPHPTTRTTPRTASRRVLLINAVEFAVIAYAVTYLLGIIWGFKNPGVSDPTPFSVWLGVGLTSAGLVAAALSVLTLHRLDASPGVHPRLGAWPRARRTGQALQPWVLGDGDPAVRHAATSAGAFLLAVTPGLVIATLLMLPASAQIQRASYPLWLDAVGAVLAGVGEELIVLSLPMLLGIRFFGQPRITRPWMLYGMLLVAGRMAYHLYYGWWALALLPWAIAMPFIYARWRLVWPLILAHTVYDMGSVATGAGWISGLGRVVLAAVLGVLLVASARGGRGPRPADRTR